MDIDCEGWARILKVFPDMDFSKDIAEKPELANYLRNAINTKSLEMENPEDLKDAPKLDNDFSKWIIINNIPKVNPEKAKKLVAVLVKLFAKRNFIITEEAIHLDFEGEPSLCTGQVYIEMKTDEQAKIASALFNGHKLDSKHTFASCTFPDFDKIMAYEAPSDTTAQTDYLELNS